VVSVQRLDLHEPAVLAEVLRLQRAAYAVEAALIGDDRIPPLHEDAAQVHAAGLHWLGVSSEAGLAATLGWALDGDVLDLHRLVVDPAYSRRGLGSALVEHLLAAHPARPAVVSTGRDNQPARRLYEGLGFTEVAEVEVLPGLRVVNYSLAR